MINKKILFIVCLSIAGCSEQSMNSDENKLPNVEYGGEIDNDTDIKKYTNADWLYNNYFGEYGLPDELQVKMMPTLMMVANGFALEHSRGEDVNSSISKLNAQIKMMYYSGEMNTAMSQLVYENETGVHEESPDVILDSSKTFSKELDDIAQYNISISEQLDIEYAEEQERLVIEHNLPYQLPDKVDKYITITQAMKAKAPKIKKPAPEKHEGLGNWEWWQADIIWSNGALGLGHMGIIDLSTLNSTPDIIDANTDKGISRHTDMNAWANKYTRVEGYNYNGWSSSNRKRNRAVNYADSVIGQGYNYNFFARNSPNSSYCSQLIWKSYRVQGVNLDSNASLIIFPSDILNHKNVNRFNSSILKRTKPALVRPTVFEYY